MAEAPPPPSDGGGYPVDGRTCQLLGPTALVVQGLMGVLVILSLVYKRHRESPKRPWKIFTFDVSKQICGQIFVHLSNLLISDQVAMHESKNPCVLYFLNILVDTTIGIGFMYLVLTVTSNILTKRFRLKGFQSGQYGDPRNPSLKFWGRQVSVYCFALLSMKLAVIALFAIWPGIFKIGQWLLSWTGKEDSVQVIVVMGIFPILLNILQFWIIDSLVKASNSLAEFLPSMESQEVQEPLVGDDSDDDETPRNYRRSIDPSKPTSPPQVPSASSRRPQAQREHSYPPEPIGDGPSTPLRSGVSARESEWGWGHQNGEEDGGWGLDGDPWGKKSKAAHGRTRSKGDWEPNILSPTTFAGS